MSVIRESAPAKINLYLHITGRRKDGYHLLDSLTVFCEMGDGLEAIQADTVSLSVDGPGATRIPGENSVLKAARLLQQHARMEVGAAITLHKRLPVAAGIGGGSADAAAALRLLRRLWKLTISEATLGALAFSLGADTPACLRGTSLYMSGVGEVLEDGPAFPEMHLVLANPGKPLMTAEVFKAYSGPFSTPARHPEAFSSLSACIQFLHTTRNDLEPAAIGLMPEIKTVLEILFRQKGCLLARMSGSGATCFGIFENASLAKDAAQAISGIYPAWWVNATTVLN